MDGSDLVSSEIYHEYWNKVRLESDNERIALQNDKNLLKLDSLILVSDNAKWLLYDRVFKNNIDEYQDEIIVSMKEYLNKDEI